MAKKIPFLILILLLTATVCDAQRKRNKRSKVQQRFSVGVMGGLTMSQLDGDNYTGFNHRAISGGLKVSTYLNEKLSFDLNLLYVQKGASIENEEIVFRVNYPKDRHIHLDYVEVPLLLSIKPYGEGKGVYFECGIAISRLINTEVKENVRDFTDVVFNDIIPEVSDIDVSSIVGFGAYLGNNFSVGMRFSFGLNKIYINPDPLDTETIFQVVPTQVLFLRNYYLSANVAMNIF